MLNEEDLLDAEMKYWDDIEEQDDGIPRRYVTIKEQIYEGESE